MKPTLLILLLCMGMIQSSPAQQFFNKRDALHSYASIVTGVVAKDNRYYCSAVVVDSINSTIVWGNKFLVFDSQGNKIIDSLYQLHDRYIFSWNNSFQSISGRGFLLVAESMDTAQNYAMIIRYDSIGNVLMAKEIAKPFCTYHEWYKVIDIKPADNNQWVMLSKIVCEMNPWGNLQHDIVLTKLDSNFNVIWHKQHGSNTMDDGGWKLLIEPDGYLVAGGRHNITQVDKNFSFRALLLKLDTAGIMKWLWLSNPSKKTFEAKDVIRTRDGGYIYCGAGDGYELLSANQTYGIPKFRGWVEKLDSNRNVVWSRAFNDLYDMSTEFKRVIEAPDGRIHLFGNKFARDSLGNDVWNLHHRGWFMTLSADGDSLRERTYYNINTCADRNWFHDAEATDDGGFMMVGEAVDECFGAVAPIQRGWLVKVDSNGCLGPGDPQCWPTDVPHTPVNEMVSVYPNPVRDSWYISNKESKKLEIIITDITGRTILQKQASSTLIQTDMSHYPPGMYLYRITSNRGILLQGKLLKQ